MIHLVTNEMARRYCYGDAETIVLMLWLTTYRNPLENLLELRLVAPTQAAYMAGVNTVLREQARQQADTSTPQRFLETLADAGVVILKEEL